MAACEVRPPRSVTIAEARFIIGSQSGSVISVTNTSPASNASIWRGSSMRRALPMATASPTARPCANTVPRSLSSKTLTL